ncbi:hypothetical protein FRC14_002404 [Serendipita sp. 396]|nr:hypothetical protein FRC14_002404 [Serendipita sp. 396]KAG8784564.1 hypothetical protein FRC15_003063 [Serendipita sp. 397]KAG8866219.1 hypothetical protein FRC20_008946 [Serendipita sp. 405]
MDAVKQAAGAANDVSLVITATHNPTGATQATSTSDQQTSPGHTSFFSNANPKATSLLEHRRHLPREVFRLLSKIPSPFPYIRAFILWQVHAVKTVFGFVLSLLIEPIWIIYSVLLVILDPMIVLLVAVYRYTVEIPMGIALAIAHALYPFYIFAMTAVLFGGLVGGCGDLLHGGIVGPWTGRRSPQVNGELHRDVQRLANGKGRRRIPSRIGNEGRDRRV